MWEILGNVGVTLGTIGLIVVALAILLDVFDRS